MKWIVLASLLVSGVSYAKDGRFRCRASGDGNRQAEIRVEKKKVRAKWQINKGLGQEVGTKVQAEIDGKLIGEITLKDDGDQLEGKFEIRKRVKVREGTPGRVGSLTCTFRED